MTGRAPSSVRNEWALPYFDLVRTSRFGVLVLGGSLGLMLTATDPRDLLGDTALVSAVFVVAVGTGLSLLPGFRRYRPGIMTAIALLDLAAIGLFGLLPGAPVIGAAIVLMPALWLAGALGLLGVAVTALATAALVAAPALLVRGTPDQGLAWAVSTVLFATLSAAAIYASNEMTSTRLLRLKQQGDELGAKNRRLRELDELKNMFIASATHDLKTPLTSILGYAEMLGEERLPTEARRMALTIENSAHRVLTMINDLLGAASIMTGELRLERRQTDLVAVVGEALEGIQPAARAGQVTITRSGVESAEALVDERRVLQILDNLLSNAVKYCPDGGQVGVTCRVDGHAVTITVTDTGIGIPDAEQQQLFGRFFRASTAVELGIVGTGLGLANARAFTEAHGGSLECTSEPGIGSTFTLVLPDGLEP